MADEAKQDQGVRIIPLEDEVQVRRWAAILGPSALRRRPAGLPRRAPAPGTANSVGIGGRS